MKKLITLLSVLTTLIYTHSRCQTLANTTWIVYDPISPTFAYFHFSADTLSFSPDNITYMAGSTYQEDTTHFSIIDLQSAPCNNDTGNYNFVIQNDTLYFEIDFDSCQTRVDVLTSYHWVRLFTGIQETNLSHSLNIYPNPASDLLTVSIDGEKNIIFFNLVGEIIKSFHTTSNIISIKDLAPGNYLVSVFDKNNAILDSRQIIKVE